MRKLVLSSALALGMAVASTSSAQDFDPAMMKTFGAAMRVLRDNPAMLTMNPGVQKEIKMDEDQVAKLREKLGGQFGGRGGGGGGGDFKERMAKMMEKMADLKDVPEDKMEEKIREVFKEELEAPMKEVESVLKPEQSARLKQIARQQNLPGGYLKPENAKDLALTDEQKTKIKEITTELEKDVAELTRSAGGGKGGGFGGFGGARLTPEQREKRDGLVKEATDKATALLTDEQKSKWKAAVGEPFKVVQEIRRPKKDD